MTKSTAQTGRDYYDDLYRADLDAEARWLEFGAVDKVDSIEALAARRGIRLESLLELGAGTGAVVREAQRRGLAREYVAVDYSAEAVEYLRSRSPGVEAVAADVMHLPPPLLRREYDLVVASHVIEHLEDPLSFLRAAGRIGGRHFLFEVPLEDLPASRLKLALGKKRENNLAGHVQFFTRASFDRLVRSAGFEIVASRLYAPTLTPEALRFVRAKNRSSALKHVQEIVTARLLPLVLGRVWARLYYAHYAVLCRRARP